MKWKLIYDIHHREIISTDIINQMITFEGECNGELITIEEYLKTYENGKRIQIPNGETPIERKVQIFMNNKNITITANGKKVYNSQEIMDHLNNTLGRKLKSARTAI